MAERKMRKISVRKPTQKRAQDTVNVILTAAAQILSSVGFDSSTTNRIAEKAGVSIGSLYQYFPNKEKLATALISRILEHYADTFRIRLQKDADLPFEEAAEHLACEIVAMYLENRALLRVIGVLIPRFQQIPEVIEARRKAVLLFAKELERRRNEYSVQEAHLSAFLIINASVGVIHATLFDDTLKYDAAVVGRELARMAIGYLRHDPR